MSYTLQYDIPNDKFAVGFPSGEDTPANEIPGDGIALIYGPNAQTVIAVLGNHEGGLTPNTVYELSPRTTVVKDDCDFSASDDDEDDEDEDDEDDDGEDGDDEEGDEDDEEEDDD